MTSIASVDSMAGVKDPYGPGTQTTTAPKLQSTSGTAQKTSIAPVTQYAAPSVAQQQSGMSAAPPVMDPMAFSQPPQYTGPAYQAQNTYGIGYTSQDPSQYKVWNDIAGTWENASGDTYTGQSDFDRAYNATNPSPLSQMTEAQKTAYWATQGGSSPNAGVGLAIPGYADQNAPGYMDALNAIKSDPASQALADQQRAYEAQRLADQNALTEQFNSDNARASWAEYANALNNQPGYAGSGMDYLDPNAPPDWWDATESGTQSGAPYNTLPNPIDAQHSPIGGGPVDQPPSQGGHPGVPTEPGGGRPGDPGYSPGVPPEDGTGGEVPGTDVPDVPVQDPTSGLYPEQEPVDPEGDLRNFELTPAPLLDRFKLAQEQYGTYADATNPQYQAALRDAARAAAATGRLGSGMLRTSYGDLANTRANALTTQRDKLFQDALLGSVNDAQTQFEDLMAEQQYQTNAQNQAFNQAVTAQELQEKLTSGAFGRALQQLTAGNANDPSNMQLTLSGIFGEQAGAAGQALQALMQGIAAGRNNAQMQKQFEELLKILNQGSSSINIPSGSGTRVDNPGVSTGGGVSV